MPRSPDVTSAELAVLQGLWSHEGAVTIRVLTDQLYPGGGAALYSTVQKLLERLEAKHWVRRHRGSGAHRFEATATREELAARQLEATADKLCEGSITPLLTHLLSTRDLSSEDRRALRQLIDELDGPPRPRGADR